MNAVSGGGWPSHDLHSRTGADMAFSVAFKCTYNDGDQGPYVGFAGTCSTENIFRNVQNHRVWCSNDKCKCRVFYDRQMQGSRPVDPCQESKLFREWKFGAGRYHHGPRAGQRIALTRTEPGKFAILTTRFPGEPEEDRRIIGLFRIASVEGKNAVIASPIGRIRLPLEEARLLYFWAYHRNKSKYPGWGTLLFRYLEDGQVHRILKDVASSVRDETTKEQISVLIRQAFGTQRAPAPTGYLAEKSLTRDVAVAALRKYGPGGEGKHHKDLKTWISKHPEVLNLSDVTSVNVEYRFCCGDAADVVFSHSSGGYTIVEIETTTPTPGAHQAIKYKSLLCAEKGLPLQTEKVKSLLVAWSIPAEVRAFCEKYNIAFQEYQLPKSKRNSG